jgi:hypothetical protein
VFITRTVCKVSCETLTLPDDFDVFLQEYEPLRTNEMLSRTQRETTIGTQMIKIPVPESQVLPNLNVSTESVAPDVAAALQ